MPGDRRWPVDKTAEFKINRCKLLSDQSPATSDEARWSSSSGWLGGWLRMPKSLGVVTNPASK